MYAAVRDGCLRGAAFPTLRSGTPVIVDGNDGRMAVAMAAAAHESARSGEVVPV